MIFIIVKHQVRAAGRTHVLLSVLTFGSAVIAAIRLGNVLGRAGHWPDVSETSTAFGWCLPAVIVAMVIGRRIPDLRGYFGAVERVLYARMLGWLAVVGAALVTAKR